MAVAILDWNDWIGGDVPEPGFLAPEACTRDSALRTKPVTKIRVRKKDIQSNVTTWTVFTCFRVTTMPKSGSEVSDDFEFIETPAAPTSVPPPEDYGVRTTTVSTNSFGSSN